MRYATVKAGTIAGIVNHDGKSDHPYGDVEFLGPLPDSAGTEWVGKSAKSLTEELDKDKPPIGERVASVVERGTNQSIPDETMGGALYVHKMNAAQALAADKAGDLKYFTFVSESKRILGKDFPKSEEKGDIVKALQAKAGNPA